MIYLLVSLNWIYDEILFHFIFKLILDFFILIPFFMQWFAFGLGLCGVYLIEFIILKVFCFFSFFIFWMLFLFEVIAEGADSFTWDHRTTTVGFVGDAVVDLFLNLLDINVENIALVSICFKPLDDILIKLALISVWVWVGIFLTVAGHFILVELQDLFMELVV